MTIKSLAFTLDINGDGVLRPWEYLEALKWLYQLPGRLVIEGLGNIPIVASTLNIQASQATGYSSLYGIAATLISLVCWMALFCTVASLTSRERDNAVASKQMKPLSLPAPPGMGIKRRHTHLHG
jgi:hypothetical protein